MLFPLLFNKKKKKNKENERSRRCLFIYHLYTSSHRVGNSFLVSSTLVHYQSRRTIRNGNKIHDTASNSK